MTNATRPEPEKLPRIAMIVSGALLMACLVWLVAALSMAKMQPGYLAAGPLTLVAMVLGASSLVLSLVLPGILSRSLIQRARTDIKAGTFQADERAELRIASTAAFNHGLVRFAILEGAAFLAGMALFAEGTWPALAIALVLIAAMGALFPFPGRFESLRDRLRGELRSN